MPDGFATACQTVHTVTCPHGTFSLADRCPVCWPRLALPASLDADEAEWIALTDDGADEWAAHDGVPLNLWREYAAAFASESNTWDGDDGEPCEPDESMRNLGGIP